MSEVSFSGASRREVLKAIGAMTVLTGVGTMSARASTAQSKTPADWSQETKLAANDGEYKDNFGWSVAVSGDGRTAIVGAPNEDNPNGDRAGSAYVFSRNDGQWTQEAKLAANEGDSGDVFGRSVAISSDGTTAIVGPH